MSQSSESRQYLSACQVTPLKEWIFLVWSGSHQLHVEVGSERAIGEGRQPDEGISITFEAKQPGPAMRVQPVRMEFGYGGNFEEESSDAYERLLLDIM